MHPNSSRPWVINTFLRVLPLSPSQGAVNVTSIIHYSDKGLPQQHSEQCLQWPSQFPNVISTVYPHSSAKHAVPHWLDIFNLGSNGNVPSICHSACTLEKGQVAPQFQAGAYIIHQCPAVSFDGSNDRATCLGND